MEFECNLYTIVQWPSYENLLGISAIDSLIFARDLAFLFVMFMETCFLFFFSDRQIYGG